MVTGLFMRKREDVIFRTEYPLSFATEKSQMAYAFFMIATLSYVFAHLIFTWEQEPKIILRLSPEG